MRLLMPMAGSGERFTRAGYTCPKPLLPLHETVLFRAALDSYPTVSLLLVTTTAIANDSRFQQYAAGLPVATISKPTKGPLETILLTPKAKDWCHTLEELLLVDCDSVLDYYEVSRAIHHFRQRKVQGGVTVRTTSDPWCSYAVVTTGGFVTQTAERQLISDQSTTGPYYFRHGEQFLTCAAEALKDGLVSISPVYNYLRARGGDILSYPIRHFQHLGTPEAYETYRHTV